MRIDEATMAILANRMRTEDDMVFIVEQIDRAAYVKVDKVLQALGGKWDRHRQAHVFPGNAFALLEPVVMTGEVTNAKQELGQFFTPPEVAQEVMALARIGRDHFVLEPSAGVGALAIEAARRCDRGEVWCVEKDQSLEARLARAIGMLPNVTALMVDFLALNRTRFHRRFDRVVMNPPFAGQADIEHVIHASTFLKPGGRLVAVMGVGFMFRQNHTSKVFRAFLDDHGVAPEDVIRLPEGAFRESGTMVRAVIVAFDC